MPGHQHVLPVADGQPVDAPGAGQLRHGAQRAGADDPARAGHAQIHASDHAGTSAGFACAAARGNCSTAGADAAATAGAGLPLHRPPPAWQARRSPGGPANTGNAAAEVTAAGIGSLRSGAASPEHPGGAVSAAGAAAAASA